MAWLLLLVIAVGAGAVRETVLAPRIGAGTAHVIGTLAVVAVFLVVIRFLVSWIVPSLEGGRLFRLGVGWTLLTVAFEFGFGHFVMGHPWSRLFHDYDLLSGRIWVLVLLTTLMGPWLLGRRIGNSTTLTHRKRR